MSSTSTRESTRRACAERIQGARSISSAGAEAGAAPDGATVPYPPLTGDLHHEVELVVALGSGGRNVALERALDCIWGYGVGIDLTRRDLQIASRDVKRPWEIGKAFDKSAPCGPLMPASKIGHPAKGRIVLKVNGQVRQEATTGQMIFGVAALLSALAAGMTLEPGDILATGTPSGVGAASGAYLKVGDQVEAEIDGLGVLTNPVVAPGSSKGR